MSPLAWDRLKNLTCQCGKTACTGRMTLTCNACGSDHLYASYLDQVLDLTCARCFRKVTSIAIAEKAPSVPQDQRSEET